MLRSPFHSFAKPTLLVAGLGQLAIAMVLLAAPSSQAAVGDCGLPVNATGPLTSDCLYTLRSAVGAVPCAPCTCDVNDDGDVTAPDALQCLRKAVGQSVTLTCPSCAASCPGSADWITHAGYGPSCSSNDDCEAGSCDAAIGLCRTASELDLGWMGTSHNIDLNDGAALPLLLDCPGAGGSCGQCTIEGVDPQAGACRCANDSRATCDAAFSPDADDCPSCSGGAFPGKACTDGAQCEGGPCSKFCKFDPEIPCATNADCPLGFRFCETVATCGSGDGITCAQNSDCIGTCSGASSCECYEAPPQPVASVDFPFCVVARLASDLSGTVNVDSGAAEMTKNLELFAYGGLSLLSPCPACGGTCAGNSELSCSADVDCSGSGPCALDAEAGDGVRGGVCIGGQSDGLSCDVGATSASFPARPDGSGGGGFSLDCLPEADTNFSGSGLRIGVVETTGDSSLQAVVPCDPASPSPTTCPCLVCSGTDDLACNTDEDCSSVSSCTLLRELACDSIEDCSDFNLGTCTALGGTRCSEDIETLCTTNSDCESVDFGTCAPAVCSSGGIGVTPSPNSCTNGVCTEEGDGEAFCGIGPDDKACDGVVKADGSGVRYCASNVDCSAAQLGFDAGACTLIERRPCFGDPIEASGAADSFDPLSVATFCVPPTPGIGQNASIGLPGPARLRRQGTLRSFCASDPNQVYQPATGGCPQAP